MPFYHSMMIAWLLSGRPCNWLDSKISNGRGQLLQCYLSIILYFIQQCNRLMQIICHSPFIAQVFKSAATVQVEPWPELPATKKFVWQNASLKWAEFHFLFPLRRQNVLQWEPHGARVGRLQAVWQQPPQLFQTGAKMRLQMTSWSHGGHLFYYLYFYYFCFFVSWWLPLPSSCWLAPGRLVLLLLLPRMSTMVLVAVILLAGHSLLLLGDFPLGLLSTTSRILCTRWFYILQGPFHALFKYFTECSPRRRHMPSVLVLPRKLASFNSSHL